MTDDTSLSRRVPTASARRAGASNAVGAASRRAEIPSGAASNIGFSDDSSFEDIIFSAELGADPEDVHDAGECSDPDEQKSSSATQWQRRGRPVVDDVPAPDMAGLNAAESKAAREKYKREKNRLAAKRSRLVKEDIQRAMDENNEEGMPLRTLVDIAGVDGEGFASKVEVGVQHPS